MEPAVNLLCSVCGKQFERAAKEARRNEKLGRPIYCSLRCSGKIHFITNIGDSRLTPYHEAVANGLRRWLASKSQELPQAREMVYSARDRAKKKGLEFSITALDVTRLMEMQQGFCAYTNMPMDLSVKKSPEHDPRPLAPSIDRKDKSKGYTLDNIVICSHWANTSKGILTYEQWVEMCRHVVEASNPPVAQQQSASFPNS
jgi:hypothetical protein